MMVSVLLALALLQSAHPGIPPVRTDSKTGPVISVRALIKTSSVAALWLEGGERGPKLLSVEPLPGEFRAWRYPQPLGDGTWVELLDGRMRPLMAYRAVLPAPGERCALEVPLVRGAWWVLILAREGGTTRVLAQYQVGPQLARIASRFGAE